MRLVFQTLCTLRASFSAVWNKTMLKTNITGAIAFDFSRGLETEIRHISAIVNALQGIIPHYIHTLQATRRSCVNANRIKWQCWKKVYFNVVKMVIARRKSIGLINRRRAKLKCRYWTRTQPAKKNWARHSMWKFLRSFNHNGKRNRTKRQSSSLDGGKVANNLHEPS